MKRILFGLTAFAVGMMLIAMPAVSQPQDKDGKDGKEGKEGKGKGPKGGKDGKGPGRFELGQIFPPPLLAELDLTPEQEQKLQSLQKELKGKLEKLLTDEQKKTIENFRPKGGMGKDGKGGMGKGENGENGGKGEKGPKNGKGGNKGDRPDRPPVEKGDNSNELLPPAREFRQ